MRCPRRPGAHTRRNLEQKSSLRDARTADGGTAEGYLASLLLLHGPDQGLDHGSQMNLIQTGIMVERDPVEKIRPCRRGMPESFPLINASNCLWVNWLSISSASRSERQDRRVFRRVSCTICMAYRVHKSAATAIDLAVSLVLEKLLGEREQGHWWFR